MVIVVFLISVRFDAGGAAHTWSVIRLSVQDAGPGIAPSDQARLFQNFVQIRPDQLQRGAGSGLGLTIAKQIVELHGGRIGVTSMEGQGSLFFFSIPFQQVQYAIINLFLVCARTYIYVLPSIVSKLVALT